ncbi:hypothetical protein, conserved [Trypanosoma brucei gambiense DAL972]|uniref:UV radiation resistance-associated gene protein n=2 Tax=Trypanosoma brucei TaxID=5691 RepID=C9ZJJ3_TRYB9|nr:hypothetical protein, conserved [Trypanosoma brucei gambiense DAL972]RHW74023.1 UV radiation resistance protein and autophagy-related subunit 14 [Trypanosoma brucei equiperdum]CBH09552.1 hypothetical protein, conserved [Trypanosoma brucei gambiense DAL972]|eukprot:XP_011771857.1 hypothetical protein, conserved [Trypanosoma brucei gambiense DAL972]
MTCSVVPPELRCFRHILHIYARNLPLKNAGDEPGAHGESKEAQENDRRCISSYFVISSAPKTTNQRGLEAAVDAGVAERASTDGGRCIYMSEVQCDTQHPVWQHIPESVRMQFASLTKFIFSLYSCTTHLKDPRPAPDTDLLLYEMLVETSHVQFVAPSMTAADELPQLPCHVDNGLHSFVLLLRCSDGVFFPLHQGMCAEREDSAEAQISLFKMAAPTAWGAGGSVTSSHNETRNGALLRRIDSLKNMSVGDLKACSTGTLAWVYLNEFGSARAKLQKALMDKADKYGYLGGEGAVVGAQHAVLKARLESARERQRYELLSLEKLRREYADERRAALSLYTQLETVEQKLDQERMEQELSISTVQEQERKHASLRTQLGRARYYRVVELRELFPIRCAGNSLHTTAAGTGYSICGFRLPTLNQSEGVSTELLQEWGLSLGCAAHLVVALSTLYGCTLPHPLLVCGGRSYVLRRPVLSPELVCSPGSGTGSDVRLPLHCCRLADRSIMDAAVLLLLLDVASVAREAGQDVIATRAEEAARTVDGIKLLGDILQGLLFRPPSPTGSAVASPNDQGV